MMGFCALRWADFVWFGRVGGDFLLSQNKRERRRPHDGGGAQRSRDHALPPLSRPPPAPPSLSQSMLSQLVELPDDVHRGLGEVQGKRDLVLSQVVVVEHEALGQVLARAPEHPACVGWVMMVMVG